MHKRRWGMLSGSHGKRTARVAASSAYVRAVYRRNGLFARPLTPAVVAWCVGLATVFAAVIFLAGAIESGLQSSPSVPGIACTVTIGIGWITAFWILNGGRDARLSRNSTDDRLRTRINDRARSFLGQALSPEITSIEVTQADGRKTITVTGEHIDPGATLRAEHNDAFVPLIRLGRNNCSWMAPEPEQNNWFQHEFVMFVVMNPNGQETRTLWPSIDQAVIVK